MNCIKLIRLYDTKCKTKEIKIEAVMADGFGFFVRITARRCCFPGHPRNARAKTEE